MRPALALLALLALPVRAAEIVYVDGRREASEKVVVKEDEILVRFEKGLRRVPRADVAKVVQDDGSVVTIERDLADAALTDAQRADLDGLAKLDEPALLQAQQRLAASLSRAVLERLKELAASKDPRTRARAAVVLVRMGVPESVEPAVAMALGDASGDVREQAASALFGIAGLVEAQGWQATLRPGLEHSDRKIRAIFALVLGQAGDEEAVPALKKDALRHSDHHIRESAAEALAALGDDAGVPLLIKMLTRTRHPAGDDAILRAEKIRVCGHLERLAAKKALPALKRVARSGHPELAAAAQRAVDAILAK